MKYETKYGIYLVDWGITVALTHNIRPYRDIESKDMIRVNQKRKLECGKRQEEESDN